MKTPTVHLNGTPRDRLVEQYSDAANALREALSRMGEACPNARDYYTQGPDAFQEAVKEHGARVERVAVTLREIEQILETVVEAS